MTATITHTKLSNCPFCGRNDSRVIEEKGKRFYVFCNCCECHGPVSGNHDRAVRVWNDSK